MKKIMAILFSLILLAALTIPAFAASSITATTMRLEKTQGTVTLTNQNGRNLPLLKNSKLYNGYTMDTKKASYAYINLDDAKANKLDEFSKAGVRKKGQNLEFFLYYGKMFFQVKKPLAQGQTYDIRTSNLSTGIRGTAGYIVVIDENTSVLFLLEGEVSLTHTDPVTGETKQRKVKAGQAAFSSRSPDQNGMQITLQDMIKEQIPGFVLEEISKNPDLRKKIEEQTGWDLTEQLNNWEEILENDQKNMEEKQRDADNTLKFPHSNPHIDALFPNPDPPSSGKSNSGKKPGKARETTLTNATAAQINEALLSYSTVRLRGTAGTMDAPITIPTEKNLRLDTGSMTMGTDAPLTVNGSLVIAADAELINHATEDEGGLQIQSPNSLEIAGTVTNHGFLRVGGEEKEGRIAIFPGGQLSNSSGSELRNEWGQIENQGVLEIQGEAANMDRLTNNGSLKIQTGGSLLNLQSDIATGHLVNTGSLSIETGANLNNTAVLETSQPLSNSGTIILSTSGMVRLRDNISTFADGTILDDSGSTASLQYILENGNRVGVVSMGALLNFAPTDSPVAYTLTDDLYMRNSDALFIPEKAQITLDLAGHILFADEDNSIQNFGDLTIRDSGHSGVLNLKGGPLQNSGALTVQGGTISGAKGAIKNDGGTLTIPGGIVESSESGYYAVEGPFTCTEEGLVRAKAAADLCTELPAGWTRSEAADANGWYSLQKSS